MKEIDYDNHSLRGLRIFFLVAFCWMDMFFSNRRRKYAETPEDEKGFFQKQIEKQLTLKPYQMKQLFYILLASIFQIGITIGLVIIYSTVTKHYPEVNNIALGLAFGAIWVTEFGVLLGFVFKQK